MSEDTFGWLVDIEEDMREAGYTEEEIAKTIDSLVR